MDYAVFDIEADDLIEKVTKIHCLCARVYKGDSCYKFSTTDYGQMKEFFQATDLVLVGHNIIRYDIPVVEKILGIKVRTELIDTLGLSWYLYPQRLSHNLEDWGVDVGIGKPRINDWSQLPIEEYLHRCQQDVEINDRVFDIQAEYLNRIYVGDKIGIRKIVRHITFKLDCAAEQEEVKWKCNIERTKANLERLTEMKAIKYESLKKIMPRHVTYKIKEAPKVRYKKDGSVSAHGEAWNKFLESQGLPEHYNGGVKVVDKDEEGNPNAHAQLKAWLFSLGWVPEHIKEVRHKKTRVVKRIPQISNAEGDDVCSSVKKLYKVEPGLVNIEEIFVLGHRIGILKGFLAKADESGFLKAEVQGFTNTLRFQHVKPLVNLPSMAKRHWKPIREVLMAPDNEHVLCGTDVKGLEDSTKRHYMYKWDPEYVEEMMRPDFDSHLDIAQLSGLLTEEQVAEHKAWDASQGKEGKSHKVVRLKAKKVNFAGIYGAMPPKLAVTANIPLSEAVVLHSVYWKRNWSVKKVAETTTVKKIGDQMWLWNPVSKFWYTLKVKKDIFSTLNQGTGAYCFDCWVRKVRERGIRICGQFHDEIIFPCRKGDEEGCKNSVQIAMDETNEELKLNVKLAIDTHFGDNYSLIH